MDGAYGGTTTRKENSAGLCDCGLLGQSVVGYLMSIHDDPTRTHASRNWTGGRISLAGVSRLGTIAALGTDLVVGTATLCSLTTVIYCTRMTDQVSDFAAQEIQYAVWDGLAGAKTVSQELPAGVLEQAQAAFRWYLTWQR